MYIEKIHIDTFGKLNDVNIEPDRGINIIEGPNESGKSTVAEFIKFVLYGVGTKDRDRVMSWRTGGAAGSLTVCTDDGRFRIERAIVGSREALQLIDAETNMPVRHVLDKITPGEYFFGVNADMFAATAFVSQLGDTAAGGTAIAEGIENILFSADESISTKRALSKLDSARVELLHKNEKGGRIHELDEECAELEVQLASASRVHDDIIEKETQLAESKKKLERAKSRANGFLSKVEQFETRVLLELYARKHAVEKHTADLRASVEASSVHDMTELRNMESMNAKVTNLRHELEEVALREATETFEYKPDPKLEEYLALGGREAVEAQREMYRSKSTVFGIVGIISFVLAIIVAVLGFIPQIGGDDSVIWFIGAGVLVLLGGAMLLLGGLAANNRRRLYENFDISALEAAIAARKSAEDAAKFASLATAEARRRYEEACNEVRRLYGCEEHMLSDQIEKLNARMRGADAIKAEYDKNMSVLEQIKCQLQNYTEDELREKLDESVDISEVDVSKLPSMRREAEFAGKMAESLEKYIQELEKTLAGLYPVASDPVRLSEELNARKAEREALVVNHSVYLLAHEKLMEAGENLRRSIAPRLASEAAAQMAHITEGKYRGLGVGADLSMSADTEGGTKPLDVLSAGTRDAAYLSLRLALISLLYRKEQPTVVFDEAFIRQDDKRLESLLRLVRMRGEQIIIFSASGRESAVMKDIGEFKLIAM